MTTAENKTEKDAPKKGKTKIVAPLYADSDPPLYVEDIGSIRVQIWTDVNGKRMRRSIPLTKRRIIPDPLTTTEEDICTAYEKYGYREFYIDALGIDDGRVLKGSARTFSALNFDQTADGEERAPRRKEEEPEEDPEEEEEDEQAAPPQPAASPFGPAGMYPPGMFPSGGPGMPPGMFGGFPGVPPGAPAGYPGAWPGWQPPSPPPPSPEVVEMREMMREMQRRLDAQQNSAHGVSGSMAAAKEIMNLSGQRNTDEVVAALRTEIAAMQASHKEALRARDEEILTQRTAYRDDLDRRRQEIASAQKTYDAEVGDLRKRLDTRFDEHRTEKERISTDHRREMETEFKRHEQASADLRKRFEGELDDLKKRAEKDLARAEKDRTDDIRVLTRDHEARATRLEKDLADALAQRRNSETEALTLRREVIEATEKASVSSGDFMEKWVSPIMGIVKTFSESTPPEEMRRQLMSEVEKRVAENVRVASDNAAAQVRQQMAAELQASRDQIAREQNAARAQMATERAASQLAQPAPQALRDQRPAAVPPNAPPVPPVVAAPPAHAPVTPSVQTPASIANHAPTPPPVAAQSIAQEDAFDFEIGHTVLPDLTGATLQHVAEPAAS